MLQTLTTRLSIVAALALTASGTLAANVPIDVGSASNGLTDIYSATFDGALVPCPGSTYCTFFAGDPAATRKISIVANPSGVINGVPGGIGPTGIPVAPVPAAGSFLDLTLNGGNTSVTLGVSSISFTAVDICLTETTACDGLNVHAAGAGMVFNPTGPVNGGALTPAGGGSTGATVPVNASGVAVFQVQNAASVVVDFSRFSQVVTSCTGTYCALITSDTLNLDVVRYVLIIDFDATFTSFTASFVGETGNNSLLYATLNSAVTNADGDSAVVTDNCPLVPNNDQADTDGDLRGNMCDNCRALANNTGVAFQCDSDTDGFGNRCDGDMNNNNVTNNQDYGLFRAQLGQPSVSPTYNKADINCNNTVNNQDYGLFRGLLGAGPGPGAGP